MVTLVNVVIQSEPAIAGSTNSAKKSRPAAATRPPDSSGRRWPRRAQARRPVVPVRQLTAVVGGPRKGDDSPAGHVQQRDDREHERRRCAVAGDRADRRRSRVYGVMTAGQPDGEPAEERHPQRPQATDQRYGERGDDQERQRRLVERHEQVGEEEPAMPEKMPDPNHAAASTRRTGTPSVAVISRSFASARIAVPASSRGGTRSPRR